MSERHKARHAAILVLQERRLLANVVFAIGEHDVVGFVLVGHARGRCGPFLVEHVWHTTTEHLQPGLTLVDFLIPVCVFFAQLQAQTTQPLVVCTRGATPARAGVIDVRLFVRWREDGALRVERVPRGAKELACLQYHLDDMFVAMVPCAYARMEVQHEDVHHKKKNFFIAPFFFE